jgi:hypothetical protein
MGALSRHSPFRLMRCLAVHVYMHERGLGKPCFFDQFAIVPASVLRPAVGVVDQPWNGTSATQSHIQGVAAKLGAHVVLHRPTDNLTGGHILHSSQIEPALIRVDVGDVGQPNDIGCHAVELLFQEVWTLSADFLWKSPVGQWMGSSCDCYRW